LTIGDSRAITWAVAWAVSAWLWTGPGGMLEGWTGPNVPMAVLGSALVFGFAAYRSESRNRLALASVWAVAIPMGLHVAGIVEGEVRYMDFDFGVALPWLFGGVAAGGVGGIAEARWGPFGRRAVFVFAASFGIAALAFLYLGYCVIVIFQFTGLNRIAAWLPMPIGGFFAGFLARGIPQWIASEGPDGVNPAI